MDTVRKNKEKAKLEKMERTHSAMSKINPADMRDPTDLADKADHRVTTAHHTVIHSIVATKLILTRPELNKEQLRLFHRPRAKFRRGEVVS